MDEFFLYKQLCDLENIASQYTEGQKLCNIIKKTADQISSRKYIAAIIGEFKRGKSSLINAIVGADILPTDILPMTAVVTRVVYGTKRKILIKYKDGRSQERAIEELVDFATKYDLEKEKTALSVQEIEVSYPSVFCKNNIELLDTPGLNDNESMSYVTRGVMGDIDAAIMVISAKEPLSMTEQNLIIDLIQQPNIRHIVFVVTFIDAMESENDKDKIIEFIRGRLSNELLVRSKDNELVDPDKARNILSEPDIFGVSSRQAMDGFINDDEDLLKESRFQRFKQELLALLTASQNLDLLPKTAAIINKAEQCLPEWKQAEENMSYAEEAELKEYLHLMRGYISEARNELIGFMRKMDKDLEMKGVSVSELETQEIEKCVKKIFIKKLTVLNSETYTHENIYAALNNAAEEAKQFIIDTGYVIEGHIRQGMKYVIGQYAEICGRLKLSYAETVEKQDKAVKDFPQFEWDRIPVPDIADLRGVDVMPFVCVVLKESIDIYGERVIKFIEAWRVVLLKQNKQDLAMLEKNVQGRLEALMVKRQALQFNYLQNLNKIKNIQEKLNQ